MARFSTRSRLASKYCPAAKILDVFPSRSGQLVRATGVELGAEAIPHAAIITSGVMYLFHKIDLFFLRFANFKASFLTMQEKEYFRGNRLDQP